MIGTVIEDIAKESYSEEKRTATALNVEKELTTINYATISHIH